MLAFRVGNIVPPGGKYFFAVPETGVLVEDYTRTGFHIKLRAHYLEHKLPVPADMERVAEDYMCRHLPEGFCYGDPDGKPRAHLLTLSDIKTRTTNCFAASGRKLVTPGEARTRGLKCGACKLNDRSVCPTCIGLTQWALRSVGRYPSEAYTDWIGVCLVDGIALPAKVNVSIRQWPDDVKADDYDTGCWMLRLGLDQTQVTP